jgi:predicted transcriptional regulator
VEKFTKGISRAKVLSVRSIMTTPAPGDPDRASVSVQAQATVEEIAAEVMDSDADVIVRNADDQAIGVLTRQTVIDVLLNRI